MNATKTARTSEMGSARCSGKATQAKLIRRHHANAERKRETLSRKPRSWLQSANLGANPTRINISARINGAFSDYFPRATGTQLQQGFTTTLNTLALLIRLGTDVGDGALDKPTILVSLPKQQLVRVTHTGNRPSTMPLVPSGEEALFQVSAELNLELLVPQTTAVRYTSQSLNALDQLNCYSPDGSCIACLRPEGGRNIVTVSTATQGTRLAA